VAARENGAYSSGSSAAPSAAVPCNIPGSVADPKSCRRSDQSRDSGIAAPLHYTDQEIRLGNKRQVFANLYKAFPDAMQEIHFKV
jgi:hypothetical protein